MVLESEHCKPSDGDYIFACFQHSLASYIVSICCKLDSLFVEALSPFKGGWHIFEQTVLENLVLCINFSKLKGDFKGYCVRGVARGG